MSVPLWKLLFPRLRGPLTLSLIPLLRFEWKSDQIVDCAFRGKYLLSGSNSFTFLQLVTALEKRCSQSRSSLTSFAPGPPSTECKRLPPHLCKMIIVSRNHEQTDLSSSVSVSCFHLAARFSCSLRRTFFCQNMVSL